MPLLLIRTRRGWELDATPGDARSSLRTYLLANIRSLAVSTETFEPPAHLTEMINEHRRDLNVIMDLRTREDIEIARFGGDEELVLDVTDCPPKEAARRILDHLKKVCGDDVAEQGAEVYDQNVVDVEE